MLSDPLPIAPSANAARPREGLQRRGSVAHLETHQPSPPALSVDRAALLVCCVGRCLTWWAPPCSQPQQENS